MIKDEMLKVQNVGFEIGIKTPTTFIAAYNVLSPSLLLLVAY